MKSNAPDDGRNWLQVSTLIDGEPMLSTFGLSILTGWEECYFSAGAVPAAALHDGQRRTQEVAAATGSRDIADALSFLAGQMGYDVINPSPFEFLAAKKVHA